jgi:hypothetical protein
MGYAKARRAILARIANASVTLITARFGKPQPNWNVTDLKRA